MNLQDKSTCPSLEEIGAAVGNPLFLDFCAEIQGRYHCGESIQYSACSWEKGWNIKFKKAGKSL